MIYESYYCKNWLCQILGFEDILNFCKIEHKIMNSWLQAGKTTILEWFNTIWFQKFQNIEKITKKIMEGYGKNMTFRAFATRAKKEVDWKRWFKIQQEMFEVNFKSNRNFKTTNFIFFLLCLPLFEISRHFFHP